jgi:hypothetical protein
VSFQPDVKLIGVYVDVQKAHRMSEVGFEVLTKVSTKMAVFWVVAPYSDRPDDGGSKDI